MGVRVAWKLLAIFLLCVSSALWLMIVRGFGALVSRGKLERENKVIRGWANRMARIIGMRVQTRGPLPQRSFLLVSNHLSYLDVLAYMSQVDARLLSKAEVASWPLLGTLARFGGTLFVDRTRRRDLPRVIGEIKSTLDQGRGVVFFPEGTSSPGLQVLPFKASLFQAAAEGGLDVSTATLRYHCPAPQRPAQWSVAWWGSMDFTPHFLAMLRLSKFDAFIQFSEVQQQSDDRKQLAQNCQRAVEAIFEPVCLELGPDPIFGDMPH